MSDSEHIDDILRDWPFDTESVSVRIVEGGDGRELIQMRVDMGLLQLETTGRPDGERPGGEETYYDFLQAEALREGEDFVMTEEQCDAADQEFVQFYHRRICWLAMREYGSAVNDADHSLEFMDFCQRHSPDEHWTISHEQYRPFVLFHRTQASALEKLEADGPEAAVQEISIGLERLRELFIEHEAEEAFEENDLVDRLSDLRETLRKEYDVGRTLHEQLADAIATEQYERAAKIRDILARRDTKLR